MLLETPHKIMQSEVKLCSKFPVLFISFQHVKNCVLGPLSRAALSWTPAKENRRNFTSTIIHKGQT